MVSIIVKLFFIGICLINSITGYNTQILDSSIFVDDNDTIVGFYDTILDTNDTILDTNDSIDYNNYYMLVNTLKSRLLENYRSDIIPNNNNMPLNMSIGLVIRAFNNIDQKEGTIELNVWLRYWWKDYNLIWDEQQWNISSLIFRTDTGLDYSIWTPDIYLYNTAETPLENIKFSNAMVYPNGDTIWSRPGIIKSTCTFDLTNFPFDRQTCELKLGSWSYTSQHLILTDDNPTIDLLNYQKNEEWELENVSYKINAIKYGCCPHKYYDITFNIIIKRFSGYYEQHIIIPTFATASLILITLLIPWKSGERISFAVTVMLSIIVFLLMLSDTLPKSNQKPLLSQMITSLTFFSLFGVFFTVLISALNDYKETHIKTNTNIDNVIIRNLLRLFKYCICKEPECHDNSKKNMDLRIINKNYDIDTNQGVQIDNDTVSNTIKILEDVSENSNPIHSPSFIQSINNTNIIKRNISYKKANNIKIDNKDRTLSDTENENDTTIISQLPIQLMDRCGEMIIIIERIYGICFLLVFIVLCIYMYISKSVYS